MRHGHVVLEQRTLLTLFASVVEKASGGFQASVASEIQAANRSCMLS
jgi:hypothetical protein